MTPSQATVWYTPGPWLGVVGPVCVLAVETTVDDPVFAALAEAAAAGADTDALLRLLADRRDLPSFAVLEPRAGGLRAVLRGTARVWCADGQELAAAGAQPWRDGVVGPAAFPARLAGPAPVTGPRLPLVLGAVFCSALDLYPPPPPPAVAAPVPTAVPVPAAASAPTAAPVPTAVAAGPPPAPQAATAQPASSPWVPPAATIDEAVTSPTTPVAEIAEEVAAAAALPYDPQDFTVARSSLTVSGPTVVAVRCPAGHLSPAHAQTCRVCDLPIGPEQQPVTVARPTLGVLRLPSGQTITLDRGVVLGRAPSARDTPTGEAQHVVSLASPEKDVSRNHLEIRLDGWHVLAVELGSVNGTVVTLPGRAPQRLQPDEPVLLERGATLRLADEVTVTFEVPV